MLITKDTILTALRTEPLSAGYYVDPSWRDNPNCGVCAVGAALRNAGLSNRAIQRLAWMLAETGTLHELSNAWEMMVAAPAIAAGEDSEAHFGDTRVGAQFREEIVAWAHEHVPNDFRLQVSEDMEIKRPSTGDW